MDLIVFVENTIWFSKFWGSNVKVKKSLELNVEKN